MATVAALTMAVTPAVDADDLAAMVAHLRGFVATVEPHRGAFVAAMINVAIAAQVAARMAMGLQPP